VKQKQNKTKKMKAYEATALTLTKNTKYMVLQIKQRKMTRSVINVELTMEGKRNKQ